MDQALCTDSPGLSPCPPTELKAPLSRTTQQGVSQECPLTGGVGVKVTQRLWLCLGSRAPIPTSFLCTWGNYVVPGYLAGVKQYLTPIFVFLSL